MKKQNRGNSLVFQFSVMLFTFTVITILVSAIVTYYAQMRSYREMRCQDIENVGDYLVGLIEYEAEDFANYVEYFKSHYDELRIPCDLTEYTTAERAFERAFGAEYPGQVLYEDIRPDEMSDELKILYYTYRHEYWLLTFERARESFNLPYTYFLIMKEDIHDVVYVIDGERTEDTDHPGYLHMADEFYNDPETHELIWRTWSTGEKQDEVYEWDNEYGNTYSYYTPLIINGEKIGLVVAEVDVNVVNEDIIRNTMTLVFRLAIVMVIVVILLSIYIHIVYISKIDFLSDTIEDFESSQKSEVAEKIRSRKYGEGELGRLAENTAHMLDSLEEHEQEVEAAARMKTDFLANMSHEIRTPMNAVIGMAEMTLREQISDNARSFIGQIKSSGRALLTIINDILDFSKIESGTMEIVPAEYEPLSMFNDVSNIIMTRLADKAVSLDLDLDTDIPARLLGDNIRIRQILINLANNAAKFTEKGHIRISVGCEHISDDRIRMTIAVEDTGIGIREENLKKIFESFSQVDSKRNRNVEGTGLGLAISERLVRLMGGELKVTSTYGEGSTFSFAIDQGVANPSPAIRVSDPDACAALYIFPGSFESECFERDMHKLGIPARRLDPGEDIRAAYEAAKVHYPGRTIFLFLESRYLSPDRKMFIDNTDDIVGVLVLNFISRIAMNMQHMMQMQKPLSVMNISLIFNREDVMSLNEQNNSAYDFTAPEAQVLLVDDNAVNLTIAGGLLAPLGMSVMKAASGKQALEMVSNGNFDIIFMDHMMPEMDGVECTHLIRERFPAYRDIPIIALTANAISEARDMLLSEGLDDFIPKPIEVHTLMSKVRSWLPEDKVKPLSEAERMARKNDARSKEGDTPERDVDLGDIDMKSAVRMLGNEKLYWNILKEYYRVITQKHESIQTVFKAKDWPSYTIEVHSLKSTSRQIGARELAEMAAELEAAGKSGDEAYILAHTQEMLDKYLSYEPILASCFAEEVPDNTDRPAADVAVLREILAGIREAADNLDLDEMEAGAEKLSSYSYPDDQRSILEELKRAVADIDTDAVIEMLDKWDQLL